MTWYYKDTEFNEPLEEWQGFVYLITNNRTGKKYIGKKTFWSTRRLKQKGKTRRKVVKSESDWRKYFGSNKELLEDIAEHGADVHREILRLCKTKGDCSYYEAKEIFERDALLKEEYYNSWLSCRIQKTHLT